MKLHSHIAAILTIASFAAGAGQTLTLLALAAFFAFAICGAFATTDTYASDAESIGCNADYSRLVLKEGRDFVVAYSTTSETVIPRKAVA